MIPFAKVCKALGIPMPQAEYRFHKTRMWRFDFAWPEFYVALEIEGGVWSKGRHTRPRGFLGDMEKYNEAAVAGWLVIRCTPQQIWSSGPETVLRALQARGYQTEAA